MTSIPWGSDPLGGSNNSPTSLSTGSYIWQIIVQDANGNSATTQTYYQVP